MSYELRGLSCLRFGFAQRAGDDGNSWACFGRFESLSDRIGAKTKDFEQRRLVFNFTFCENFNIIQGKVLGNENSEVRRLRRAEQSGQDYLLKVGRLCAAGGETYNFIYSFICSKLQTLRSGAKKINSSVSVISRYERDEMTPSVDTAKKLAEILGSTVGYLLGETDNANLFKDPAMLHRLSELDNMQNEDKTHILHVLDNFIKAVKLKNIAAL